MRRHLLPVLLLPLALVHPAGAAAPAAGTAGAALDLTVRSAGHNYDLQLLGVGNEVRVELRELGASDSTKYVGSAAAFSATAAGASLKAALGGLALTVTWTADSSIASSGDSGTISSDEVPAPDLGYYIAGHGGTAKVSLGDVACTVETFAIVGTVVAQDSAASTPALAKAPALDGGTCGDAKGVYSAP